MTTKVKLANMLKVEIEQVKEYSKQFENDYDGFNRLMVLLNEIVKDADRLSDEVLNERKVG
jgi:hypothetical protein